MPELVETERHTLRGIGIRAVHRLNVEMGLRGVPGVATSADLIAGAHPLTRRHLNRASLKVHESNVIRAFCNLDDDVIPKDRGQSPPNPPGLTQPYGMSVRIERRASWSGSPSRTDTTVPATGEYRGRPKA